MGVGMKLYDTAHRADGRSDMIWPQTPAIQRYFPRVTRQQASHTAGEADAGSMAKTTSVVPDCRGVGQGRVSHLVSCRRDGYP